MTARLNTRSILDDGTPYKKKYDPRGYLRVGEQGVIERLQEAFVDLKSNGKSLPAAA